MQGVALLGLDPCTSLTSRFFAVLMGDFVHQMIVQYVLYSICSQFCYSSTTDCGRLPPHSRCNHWRGLLTAWTAKLLALGEVYLSSSIITKSVRTQRLYKIRNVVDESKSMERSACLRCKQPSSPSSGSTCLTYISDCMMGGSITAPVW